MPDDSSRPFVTDQNKNNLPIDKGSDGQDGLTDVVIKSGQPDLGPSTEGKVDENKSFSAPVWKKDLTPSTETVSLEQNKEPEVTKPESFDPAIDTGLTTFSGDEPVDFVPDKPIGANVSPFSQTSPLLPPAPNDASSKGSILNEPSLADLPPGDLPVVPSATIGQEEEEKGEPLTRETVDLEPSLKMEEASDSYPGNQTIASGLDLGVDQPASFNSNEAENQPGSIPSPLPDPAFANESINGPAEQAVPASTESVLPPPILNGATEDKGPSFFRRFKKLFLALVLVLFLAVAGYGFLKFVLPTLQGNGSSNTGGGKVTTLTYWGLWESPEIMKTVIADFEEQNPTIKVNYEQSSKTDYRERLQSRLAQGDGPDLFRYHVTWVPMLATDLEPVPAEVISSQQFETDFYPVVVNNLRYQGKIMGVPLEVDTLALFYNEAMFQKASVTPPRDWNEFYDAARDLTVTDGGQIRQSGAALGLTANVEHWSDVLGLLMLQSGVDLSRPNTPQAESVLNYFTKFKTNRIWDESLPSSMIAFASGKLAMYFGFSWDVFEIKEINPQLSFRVIPVPQLTETEINWASFWVEGVSQKSKNKPQAWAFLQYLARPEVLRKLYQQQSQVRLFGEPYARKEMAGEISSNPMVAPFVAQANQAQTWYLCSRTFDNGLNDRMIRYFEDAVNAISLQNKSAADALNTAAAGVNQMLSRYQVSSSL